MRLFTLLLAAGLGGVSVGGFAFPANKGVEFGEHGDIVFQESIREEGRSLFNKAEQNADCRAHIRKVVCLKENNEAEVCQDGGENYAEVFAGLYDNFPPALQKMFCSLRVINVLQEFNATAYAGLVKNDEGETIGAVMGIRQSVIDEGLDLQTWASWKEQLSFGGVVDSYSISEHLPAIDTASNGGVNDFLYFVVAHEFGHMFDMANALNRLAECNPKPSNQEPVGQCPMAEGSWGALSWQTTTEVTESNRFSYRRGLCFYSCNGEAMTAAAAPELYEGLAGSNFISTYAATNPWDDFADSLAYHLMAENLGTTYVINTRQGAQYDVIARLRSPLLQEKREYIREFLGRSDIIYP